MSVVFEDDWDDDFVRDDNPEFTRRVDELARLIGIMALTGYEGGRSPDRDAYVQGWLEFFILSGAWASLSQASDISGRQIVETAAALGKPLPEAVRRYYCH